MKDCEIRRLTHSPLYFFLFGQGGSMNVSAFKNVVSTVTRVASAHSPAILAGVAVVGVIGDAYTIVEHAFFLAVEEQPVVEEEPALEEEPLVVVADDEEPEESTFIRPWMKWAAASVLVLVLMAVSALGGYHYALQEVADHGENEAELIIASDMIASAPVQKVETVAKDTSVVDSTMKTQVKAPDIKPVDKPVDKPEVKPEPKPEVKPEQKPAEEIDPYAAKDERVRLGAYRIVGTKEIVEVQAGQTFYSICKAHLGPDMQCYVEVYNDLPQNPKVKVGQKIKIPQLQLKKRRNR